MIAKVLMFILQLAAVRSLERNQNCTTPNGIYARCVSIYDCAIIFDDLKTGEADAVDFARRSQCGYDSAPLVCCGSTAYLEHHLEIVSAFGARIGNTSTKNINPIWGIAGNRDEGYAGTLPDRTVCGLERESGRIIGGEVAELDEFPWMAALEYKSTVDGGRVGIRCEGTLINTRYVLTAAHCILNKELAIFRVWLGDWNITSDPDCLESHIQCNDLVVKLQVEDQIVHPFYSRRTNDVGLVKLERDVEYTDYIRPICLPSQNQPLPPLGTELTVAGWGATENGPFSTIKLKVSVPLVATTQCRAKRLNATANDLCAGGRPGRDACRGDSGGPLMRAEDRDGTAVQWFQEGIVSYGDGCGRAGVPAVYARVSRYMEWIVTSIRNK